MSYTWPDAHTDLLRDLWQQGLHPAEIARELNRVFEGATYTRSSVLGKAHRMGWVEGSAVAPKHKPDPKAPARRPLDRSKSRRAPPGKAYAKGVYSPAPSQAAPDSTVTAFNRHVAGTCSWPIGDPRADDFRLCGAKRERGSYCEEHAAVAYQAGTALTPKKIARAARRFRDQNVITRAVAE